jgi:transposase
MTDEVLALAGEEISAEDWQRTPASVKRLLLASASEVAELKERVALLEEENRLLREQLASNSQNSSRPPSSDGPGAKAPRSSRATTGKKRGGQPGHQGHKRKLVPVEQCQKVVEHYPEQCRRCGAELFGSDPRPYRHQVVELPVVEPYVEEHRLHQLSCAGCGDKTRAGLPREVAASGYGPRLVATVALLGGMYRASERLTQMALADLFGVVLSLGTVNTLRQEASKAVACAVDEAHTYTLAGTGVKEQAVVGADETGFAQGNADGGNPTRRKAWLWVAVTALVTVFQVSLSRGQEAARALLGTAFAGILGSDRWSGYNWLAVRLPRRS